MCIIYFVLFRTAKFCDVLKTGTLTEADSLAPIYCDFLLPHLDEGVPIDKARTAYVPDDPDAHDCMNSMPHVDAKPKGTPKPGACKPKPKKGYQQSPRWQCRWLYRTPSKTLKNRQDHALLRLQQRRIMRNRHNSRASSWSHHKKQIHIHCLSRKDSHRHDRDWRTVRIW